MLRPTQIGLPRVAGVTPRHTGGHADAGGGAIDQLDLPERLPEGVRVCGREDARV